MEYCSSILWIYTSDVKNIFRGIKHPKVKMERFIDMVFIKFSCFWRHFQPHLGMLCLLNSLNNVLFWVSRGLMFTAALKHRQVKIAVWINTWSNKYTQNKSASSCEVNNDEYMWVMVLWLSFITSEYHDFPDFSHITEMSSVYLSLSYLFMESAMMFYPCHILVVVLSLSHLFLLFHYLCHFYSYHGFILVTFILVVV